MGNETYGRGRYRASGVAYASFPVTGNLVNQLAIDNAGNEYKWTGHAGATLASWVKTGPGVAEDFDADKSVGTSPVREPIPTGARGFTLKNTHASQYLRVRTGDSTVEATAGSGYHVSAGEKINEDVNGQHTHISVIGSGASTTYSLIWKF